MVWEYKGVPSSRIYGGRGFPLHSLLYLFCLLNVVRGVRSPDVNLPLEGWSRHCEDSGGNIYDISPQMSCRLRRAYCDSWWQPYRTKSIVLGEGQSLLLGPLLSSQEEAVGASFSSAFSVEISLDPPICMCRLWAAFYYVLANAYTV